jgi:deazaflavin-dependent oxidoreductase (nitroreductase family)
LPPRWFVVLFWHGHRALLRVTGGRVGLWRPRPGCWGALWLTTVGRRTGRPRQVVVGYVEDGRNLVTMAMNGWDAPEPGWWLNLQAHPGATARTRDGTRPVRARRAQGDERERLWSRWAEIDKNLDAYAARRPTETAVVVFEPQDTADPAAGSGPAGRGTGLSEGGAPWKRRRSRRHRRWQNCIEHERHGRRCGRWRLLDDDDDLAFGVSFAEIPQRFGHLVQLIAAVDDRGDLSRLEELNEGR